MVESHFLQNGIRFQCQGSGNCCVSHGDYGHVYLTKKDRRLLASHLGIRTSSFTRKFCELNMGVWRLKDTSDGSCIFLKKRRCGVYAARPTQCRTWPFWPEVLNPKVWSTEVKGFCPGVDKGKVWTRAEINEQLTLQKNSEAEYGS